MSSPPEVGTRLKILRKLAKLNRDDLAHLADVNPTSISFWENARSNLQLNSAKKLINAFNQKGVICTQLWLLEGNGSHPYLSTEIAFSDSSDTKQINLPNNFLDEINLFKNKNENAVVVEVKNNNMFPIYQSGDIIGGIWQGSVLIPNLGLDCIVNIKGNIDVRRVFNTDVDNEYYLTYLYQADLVESNISLIRSHIDEICPIIRFWKKY